MSGWTRRLLAGAAVMLGVLTVAPAEAEVRFGRNVRIGGHDVSGQSFNRNRRGEFHLHRRQPPRPGCFWRANGDGSRAKVCHLKRR